MWASLQYTEKSIKRFLRGAKRSSRNVIDLAAHDLFEHQHRWWQAVQNRNYLAGEVNPMNPSNQIKFAGQSMPSEFALWNNDQERLLAGNKVYDQGDTSECVAYSFSQLAEVQVLRSLQQQQQQQSNQQNQQNSQSAPPSTVPQSICFSKLWIYNWRDNYPMDGMEGRDCVQILLTRGMLKQEDYARFQQLEDRLFQLQHRIDQGHHLSTSQQQEYQSDLDTITQEAYVLVKGNCTSSAQANFIQNHNGGIFQRGHHHHHSAGSGENGELVGNADNGKDLVERIPLDDCADVAARVFTVEDLKMALYFNGPAPIIVPVKNIDAQDGMIWRPPAGSDTNEEESLGHCMTIVLYSDAKQAFLVRNSWGENWCDHGHCWFPYADIQAQMFWEIWTVFQEGKLFLHYVHLRDANWAAKAGVNSTLFAFVSPPTATAALNRSNHKQSWLQWFQRYFADVC